MEKELIEKAQEIIGMCYAQNTEINKLKVNSEGASYDYVLCEKIIKGNLSHIELLQSLIDKWSKIANKPF